MRYRFLILVAVGVLVCSLAYADVPRLINFQGRLTDSSGKFVADGNYSVTFSIYSLPSGGSALWTETQSVAVAKGLFNVILGTITPIPNSIFDSFVDTYLGVQVGADPEMTPRQRLTSMGYSYYSLNSDKLDGLNASDFTSPVSDFGRSGVATNLYEGSSTLTNKYVNVAGPDSVYSSSGTAFLGKASGGSGSDMIGVMGYTNNTSSGRAWGGYFGVSDSGTGYQHYGVVGYSQSASNDVAYTSGVIGEGYANGTGGAYGVIGLSSNTSSGPVFAGYFSAGPNGTGEHYGVLGESNGASDATAYGNYGFALNSSTGDAYGGYFTTASSGNGDHYGVYGEAYGSGSDVYGSYGYASNNSAYTAFGGYFEADSEGTWNHIGVQVNSYGNDPSDYTYGVFTYAQNSSSADVYSGLFVANSVGIGGYTYGVLGQAYGNSSLPVTGSYGDAYNGSDGDAYAGYFYASGGGSGKHYGVYSESFGGSDSAIYGVYGYGYNYSTGDAYGGFFETTPGGTGIRYGLRAEGYGGGSSGATYGSYSYAENASSGYAAAGRFIVASSGTGLHDGVNVTSYGASSASTYGVYSVASNSSSGGVFGGAFNASSATGIAYGVSASALAPGYAGYFNGNTVTTGSKSAAVKVEDGGYRLLYAMESPENWFEDFGEGTLVNGRALVQIDPLFAQSVNTSIKYHVFLTPQDEPLTLAVANRTANSFEVRGPAGSNISFSYRIVAKRKGYEDLRMAKMLGSTPEEMQAEQAKRMAASEEERANMIKQGRRGKTEQEIQQYRPKPPEIKSVQKVRKERPKTDTEKMSVGTVSEK